MTTPARTPRPARALPSPAERGHQAGLKLSGVVSTNTQELKAMSV